MNNLFTYTAVCKWGRCFVQQIPLMVLCCCPHNTDCCFIRLSTPLSESIYHNTLTLQSFEGDDVYSVWQVDVWLEKEYYISSNFVTVAAWGKSYAEHITWKLTCGKGKVTLRDMHRSIFCKRLLRLWSYQKINTHILS